MFFLALRHLLSRKRQTLLTLLGILLGAGGYVVLSGFMLGFQSFVEDQLINNDAHIRVSAREEYLSEHGLDQDLFPESGHVFWPVPPSGLRQGHGLTNPAGWYRLLEGDPRVKGWAPQMEVRVLLNKGGASASLMLLGVEPIRQQGVSNLSDYMVEGRMEALSHGGAGLLLGQAMLERLGARVGQTVLVAGPGGHTSPFRIVGAYDTGIRGLDLAMAYTHIKTAQTLNGTPGQVNSVAVRLHQVAAARAVATGWATLSPDKVESWDQAHANFLNIFKIQNLSRYLTITIILAVSAFGIYNVLNMTVNNKRKEVAILRSMGYEPKDIIWLFFSQGLLLGLLGGALGLVAGFFVCLYLQGIPLGEGPHAGFLKISFDWTIYLYGLLLALVASCGAGLLPARAAGRLSPIEIIRSGAE